MKVTTQTLCDFIRDYFSKHYDIERVDGNTTRFRPNEYECGACLMSFHAYIKGGLVPIKILAWYRVSDFRKELASGKRLWIAAGKYNDFELKVE